MKRSPYLHGLALMLGAVMPATCLLVSVAAWLDPEEGASFMQTLMNNGVSIFLLMLLPFSTVSALHTRVLLGRQEAPRGLSIVVGTGLGLSVVLLVLLAMAGTLVPGMWGLVLWGVVTGAVYGAAAKLRNSTRSMEKS
jgi:hypothetical protein